MATPTVVLVPVWGAGHLMSMLEAGKRLLARGGRAFSLTVLVLRPPTEHEARDVDAHIRREEASGLDVRFVRLPAVEPPRDFVGIEEFVSRFVQLHAPHVGAALSALPAASPAAALVLDFFCTTLLDVARDLAVPAYVYFTASAGMLALFLRLPSLHEEVTVEFEELDGAAVDVPGLPPLPPTCLPNPVMDKKNPNYTWFVYHGRRFAETDGVIVNTAAELERSVLAAIADGRCTPGVRAPMVYPIGPVISFDPPRPDEQPPHECARWLDAQPPGSVVLLCFGSVGFFDAPQAHEVARGLERSGHRFLWVLRGPPAPGSRHPSDANLAELLPDGFLERTKSRGLVWPTKAPQKEILAHAAVGGFVTHGGWNSTLESLWHGVPMAPWPLYAEQHLNAFTLVAYMGVAVAMKVNRKRNNFVEAAEVERAVKELMGGGEEGRKAREKARTWIFHMHVCTPVLSEPLKQGIVLRFVHARKCTDVGLEGNRGTLGCRKVVQTDPRLSSFLPGRAIRKPPTTRPSPAPLAPSPSEPPAAQLAANDGAAPSPLIFVCRRDISPALLQGMEGSEGDVAGGSAGLSMPTSSGKEKCPAMLSSFLGSPSPGKCTTLDLQVSREGE